MDFSLPEENELVLAVIKKILPYGAFCVLPEYNNIEAFLHVSEIAPRWIKNIHEFISEGQHHVLKVHHIDQEKNQVDVSLKRVTEEEKKAKMEFVRTDKRATKLLEIAVKQSKTNANFSEIKKVLESRFGDLYSCLEKISEKGESEISDISLPPALVKEIVEIAKKNIKKSYVELDRTIYITCYGDNGIEDVKSSLATVSNAASIHYLGAPRYKISLKASTYKAGEKKLNEIVENIKNFAQKNNCEVSLNEE